MAGEPASRRARQEEPERALIEAAQRDPACFAQLYEDNFERVYAFIVRRLHDRDQAQDLTADVFHKALKNLSRFQWRGAPFAAWLFRIAANAIADFVKRTARFEEINLSETSAFEPPGSADLAEVEYRARLFKLVERLPGDQRSVITMRFAHQKSVAEIAKHIGRSEGAVKQLQLRGLKTLRAMVGEDETST